MLIHEIPKKLVKRKYQDLSINDLLNERNLLSQLESGELPLGKAVETVDEALTLASTLKLPYIDLRDFGSAVTDEHLRRIVRFCQVEGAAKAAPCRGGTPSHQQEQQNRRFCNVPRKRHAIMSS